MGQGYVEITLEFGAEIAQRLEVAATNYRSCSQLGQPRDARSAVVERAYIGYGPEARSGLLAACREAVGVRSGWEPSFAHRLRDEAIAATLAEGLSESSDEFADVIDGHSTARLERAFDVYWWSGVLAVLRL